jgi:hypothetical protein
MTLIEFHTDPHPAGAPMTAPDSLLARLRRWMATIRRPQTREDPLGWDPCGCIHALRDTCDPPPQRDSQYRAAFRHAFAKS